MIGNETDAAIAADLTMNVHYILSDEGSSREAYLINGVVYKRELHAGTNLAEIMNYDRLSTQHVLPEYIRLPEMELHYIDDEVILAAEYVDGYPTGECFDRWAGTECSGNEKCLSARIQDEIESFGISDLCWGNVLVKDSVYYLVDLEC